VRPAELAHVDTVAPPAEAGRMTGYGAAETIDRAAIPLPDAVARTHPDGIDVLADVASDAGQFAALAGHVRPGGTALTTRYAADPQTLAQADVTGVNFALPMTVPLLDRLASRVAAGSIVSPPITRSAWTTSPPCWAARRKGNPSSRCRPRPRLMQRQPHRQMTLP
jgi:NADPH:quinone reductase